MDRPRSDINERHARQGAGQRDDFPYLLLGQHIRNFRLQLRQEYLNRPWSQEDLAVAIGTDKGHINRIECGRQLPTLDTLTRICDALDLNWPGRRRLIGLAGFLQDLPGPRQDDLQAIESTVLKVLGQTGHPACLIDQEDRIWDANTEFAVVFLGYESRDAALEDIAGKFLLELMCESHAAHAYLRRSVSNFDQMAMRLIALLRIRLQKSPASSQWQALLNDVLADARLCSLWLKASAQLSRNDLPEFLDHQVIEVGRSPIGPYSADLWHASLWADERFRVLHIVPHSDDAKRRFAALRQRQAPSGGPKPSCPPHQSAGIGDRFPHRPIRLHVPWASGGITDVGARILAPLLQEQLGQPVSVINCDVLPSPATLNRLASLPADGYDLVFVNQAVLADEAAEPPEWLMRAAKNPDMSRFDPLACHAIDPFVLFVRAECRYGSMRDLVRDAALNPGGIVVGTSGRGTPAHLGAMIIEAAAGVRFQYRHYNGSLEHIARFLSGETDIACLGSGISLPAVRAGELRALLSLTRQRFSLMPDVPTLAETGYAGPALASIRHICLPHGVAEPARDPLERAIKAAFADIRHTHAMRQTGLEPGTASRQCVLP
ncbi:MAG: tripartite tricarboxylate transporter substrate-binding protein [Devosia sp.]